MSGDPHQMQNNPYASAAQAQGSGTAGTAGTAVQVAQMPQWQRGMMGAMTGNPVYGKNAPAIHQMMSQGMGMMQQPQGQPPQLAQGQGQPAPPSQFFGGMRPQQPQPGAPQVPGAQGMAQAPQNPWLQPNPWQRQ